MTFVLGRCPIRHAIKSMTLSDLPCCEGTFASAPGAYRKRFGRNGISPADFAAKDGSRQKKHIFEAGLQTG